MALPAVDANRSRSLGALLDVEVDGLAADKAVEVERGVERATMEEVLLRIVRGDEAEAAIGDDLLDSSAGGHEMTLRCFPNRMCAAEVGSERGRPRVLHDELP
jgi:hypothetical protein